MEDDEFLKTIGSWVYNAEDRLSEKIDLYRDIVVSPHKNDPFKCAHDNYIESLYCPVKKSGKIFYDAFKQKGFSIFHCYIRSLEKNKSLLHDFLTTVKTMPDIIAISESKINENTSANLNIPGYAFVNINSKAGGVALYVSNDLEFSRRSDLDISGDGIESCWIELARTAQKNVVIGCVYRHPKSNRELFHNTLKKQLEQLNTKGREVLVIGDFNENLLKYNKDKQTSEYLDMLLSLGFMPIITKPTRITDHTATLIDHIYTNTPEKLIESGICLADISDHLPVFCTMANTLPTNNEPRFFRDFRHFNEEAFHQDLIAVGFKTLISNDANESISAIVSKLRAITDCHAPLRKASKRQRKRLERPWITKAIMHSIKQKHKLIKTHLYSTDPGKVKEYKAYSNKLNRIIHGAKKNYFSKQFELNKENIKYTWKLIGKVISTKKGNNQYTIKKLLRDNRIYVDKRSICDQLNNHFISVGNGLADKLPKHDVDPLVYLDRSMTSNSFIFRGICPTEVYDEIMSLKIDKSALDIPRKCIKHAANHIYEALSMVFNQSLLQGIFPENFKISKVTPIDKGGEEIDPFNYRPISTLSALTQIFEKLVCKQLVNYLEKHEILYEFQFGFRKGHSTSQAIAEIADNLRNAIDDNLYSCGVFLDFSKAFDTVNHAILLKKLERYGIRGVPLQFFASYLTNRQQYVQMGNTVSSKQTMTCGIPQGSSLGPVLFLIYINDLPNSSNALTFRIFADDTNVFASARDLKVLEKIVNAELKKVKIWCDVNRLSINFSKTNFMIIKSQKKKDDQVNVNIESADGTINVLQRKQKIKYLGVLLDETMSFNHHISYICTRIARNNGIISKPRHYLTFPQMKQIYYSLIYPYISYAILAWGSAYKTHINKIQIKQNHSARLIFFATDHGEHTESALPLLNLLDVLTVHNVYRFHILKFTYLWHKGLLPKPFSTYFQYASNVHKYNTRYASKQNLYVKKVRTNMGKQTIGYAACVIWDEIPLKLKELSVYQFSKQLTPYLLSEQHN